MAGDVTHRILAPPIAGATARLVHCTSSARGGMSHMWRYNRREQRRLFLLLSDLLGLHHLANSRMASCYVSMVTGKCNFITVVCSLLTGGSPARSRSIQDPLIGEILWRA
jgi:hypothetical protein